MQSVQSKCYTIANKLLKPLTKVGTLVNLSPKASDILCAGSVDKRSTDSRTRDNWIAKLQLEYITFKGDYYNIALIPIIKTEYERTSVNYLPACSFTYTSFTTDENPFQTFLADYVL